MESSQDSGYGTQPLLVAHPFYNVYVEPSPPNPEQLQDSMPQEEEMDPLSAANDAAEPSQEISWPFFGPNNPDIPCPSPPESRQTPLSANPQTKDMEDGPQELHLDPEVFKSPLSERWQPVTATGRWVNDLDLGLQMIQERLRLRELQ